VPEAAINKNRDTIFGESEVWRARQSKMPPPTLDAGLPK
jgi:hypothetical protein